MVAEKKPATDQSKEVCSFGPHGVKLTSDDMSKPNDELLKMILEKEKQVVVTQEQMSSNSEIDVSADALLKAEKELQKIAERAAARKSSDELSSLLKERRHADAQASSWEALESKVGPLPLLKCATVAVPVIAMQGGAVVPTRAEFVKHFGRNPDKYEKRQVDGLAFMHCLEGATQQAVDGDGKISTKQMSTHLWVAPEKRIKALLRMGDMKERAYYLAVWTALDENQTIELDDLRKLLSTRRFQALQRLHVSSERLRVFGGHWYDEALLQDGKVMQIKPYGYTSNFSASVMGVSVKGERKEKQKSIAVASLFRSRRRQAVCDAFHSVATSIMRFLHAIEAKLVRKAKHA